MFLAAGVIDEGREMMTTAQLFCKERCNIVGFGDL